MGKVFTNPWARPLYDFRKELGLPKGESPFFEAQHSPHCALALFSKHFAAPQQDWPKNSQATGFLFYDGPDQALEPKLESFLQLGDPPVVFTLGSAAVYSAGDFYLNSLEAIKKLKTRAVLLVGKEGLKTMPVNLPENVFVAAYAPFSKLFTRASAVVHQGGIGTTAQTLRAGSPSLIMPFAHDQFDNGLRIQRLGVGLTLKKQDYQQKAADSLGQLLVDTQIKDGAKDLAQKIQSEAGLEQTIRAITRTLR
jgi:UDP:flavonoid glycosyltransferase YjiC (YdhE family)